MAHRVQYYCRSPILVTYDPKREKMKKYFQVIRFSNTSLEIIILNLTDINS